MPITVTVLSSVHSVQHICCKFNTLDKTTTKGYNHSCLTEQGCGNYSFLLQSEHIHNMIRDINDKKFPQKTWVLILVSMIWPFCLNLGSRFHTEQDQMTQFCF